MVLGQVALQTASVLEMFPTELADVLPGRLLHSAHHLLIQGVLLLLLVETLQVERDFHTERGECLITERTIDWLLLLL